MCLLTCTSPLPAHAWEAQVLRVVDGDTLLAAPRSVARPEQAALSVRLYGMDAPELHQPGGEASREALAALVGPGDIIEVVPVESDRHDRAVGLAVFRAAVLNLEQIRAGHAWVYPQYCRARFCNTWKKQEDEARRLRRGLWSEPGATPPWEWRKGK